MVKKSFLAHFNPLGPDSWTEISKGRVGRLRLEGPSGDVDLYVTYFDSGATAEIRAARRRLAHTLSANMSPHSRRLSIVMGDFNFVTVKEDRSTLATSQWSGESDLAEAELFDKILWKPHSFHELWQPHKTHQSGLASSRLDRVYSNHHVSDQLDRVYTCCALPPVPNLSAHNPISFARQIPREAGPKQACIDQNTIHHKEFPHRVTVE